MSQDYRVNFPGGVKIEATGVIIYPGDPEWLVYEEWLAAQPGPAFPGGPVPAGTGLLPYVAPVLTLAQQRTEMLARLDANVHAKRDVGTITAAGHTWKLSATFIAAVFVHRAVMPPIPAGFTLPDAARVQVAINNAALNAIADAISARFIAVNSNFAVLVAAINASATPLAIDLEAGWPS